ncbi:hypothetical protein, partial [Bacillus subtilis]|uniref:hypothetical protein n=1 Tax=Bacillus subtilis TaxID=1423 RepID=UPI003C6C1A75
FNYKKKLLLIFYKYNPMVNSFLFTYFDGFSHWGVSSEQDVNKNNDNDKKTDTAYFMLKPS